MVSVVLPVLNEEEELVPCVLSVVGQAGVEEVLVVDDGSTDRTPEVAGMLARVFPEKVRYMPAGPKPDGWEGPAWAVYRGALFARSIWVLRIEADTRLKPGALAQVELGGTLVSCAPEVRCVTFWERALLPLLRRIVLDYSGRFPTAWGKFMLLPRHLCLSALEDPRVHGSYASDMRTAQVLGGGVFFDGTDVCSVRQYRSWQDIWDGWSRVFADVLELDRGRLLRLLAAFPVLLARYRHLGLVVVWAAILNSYRRRAKR